MAKESTVTHLYIVRHGETEWNRKGLLQGQLDSPLSELGLQQAKALQNYFRSIRYDTLVCSDLNRAVRTAEIIDADKNSAIVKDCRLRERNLGVAQGLTTSDFASKYPDEYKGFSQGNENFQIRDGESIRQRFERSISCILECSERFAGKSVVIVTHGGVLDSIFRYIVEMPLTKQRTFSLFNASVNVIQVQDSSWNIMTWGYVDHLKQLGSADDWYRGPI